MNGILLDDNYDLIFRNGDIAQGEVTTQSQNLLLITNKGDWKHRPWMGVGLGLFLKDEAWFGEVSQEINRQFEADGMEVNDITFDDYDKINIDAEYNS